MCNAIAQAALTQVIAFTSNTPTPYPPLPAARLQLVEEAHQRWLVEEDGVVDDITAVVVDLHSSCAAGAAEPPRCSASWLPPLPEQPEQALAEEPEAGHATRGTAAERQDAAAPEAAPQDLFGVSGACATPAVGVCKGAEADELDGV